MVLTGTPRRAHDAALLSTRSGARTRIMTAAGRMLETQRFADLSVASILSASGTAKGSFYFYFADKDDLLAALVREAVGTALDAAQAWTGADPDQDPVEALRAGTLAGARLWQAHAPVLRAVVEA